jgi:short-subunit dehydrogenase
VFDVNVFGLMRATQKFLPLLRQSKGRVINVSSILGALTVPEMGVYSASKHAMESLSDAMRRELRPLDVSVSVVQPGGCFVCVCAGCGVCMCVVSGWHLRGVVGPLVVSNL